MTRKSFFACMVILALGISGIGAYTCLADPATFQGPTCTVTPSTAVVCLGATAAFCVTAEGGVPPYTYCWQKAPYSGPCICTTDCFMMTDVTLADAGTYRVIVTDVIGDSDTCYADLVVDSPTCTVDPPSAEICEGDYQAFCAVATGGIPPYTFLWSSGETTQCITKDVAGTYEVTVTDDWGCSSTCEASLTVYPQPACTVDPPSAEICEGGSETFCALVTGGTPPYTYLWSSGETAPCITKDVAGTYEVTVTDVWDCVTTCSAYLVVHATPICEITGANVICEGETAVFCGPPQMAAYTWTGPYGFSATTQCIAVGDDLVPGTYRYDLTIVDVNGCESSCYVDLLVEDCAGLPGVVDVPTAYALRQPEPNPSYGTALIIFDMPRPGPATLKVFDVSGRVIRTLIEGQQSAGRHSVAWKGEDEAGHFVGPGTYLVQFRAGDFIGTKKITVLR